MIELIKPEFPNFGKYCIERGAKVKELYIPVTNQEWPGLCNPSIYNDNGQLRCIVRNINFVMHTSLDNERNWCDWGPLLYANRPEDGRWLKTRNFITTIDDNLNITNYTPIDTSRLDKKPIWEFVGLEDMRLVRWNNKLYGIGVRRDDNTTGVGRMEMSMINEDGKELGRAKIDHKSFDYCEKNWVPVLDEPYTFVRFSYPTCIVKTNDKGIVQSIKEYPIPEGITPRHDMQLRGSSQVFKWKNYRIGLFHTCNLYIDDMNKKYARYCYHFIVWDMNWNLVKISRLFCFNNWMVEFSNGMCYKDGKFYFSFAMQDNMAFLMKVDEKVVEDFIFEKENNDIVDNIDDDFVTQFFFNDNNPEFLSRYGNDLYQRGMLTAAHAVFQRAADINTDINSYNYWFMKTRCVADVGDRDGMELDGWWKCIMMDKNRPEAYLAISAYYQYRDDPNQAYYFAYLAYIHSENNMFFYNNDDYLRQYLITMLFTEHHKQAERYIESLPSEYQDLKDRCKNIVKDRKITRVL